MASSLYQPAPRFEHSAVQVQEQSYLWGGHTQDYSFSSRSEVIDIFDCNIEEWKEQGTTGVPPPRLYNGASTLLCEDMYYFGGHDGRQYCNTVYKLQTRTLEWREIAQNVQAGGPLRKIRCGIVAYQQELAVIGGFGPAPTGPLQSGAEFIKHTEYPSLGWTNEFHLFNVTEGKWSSPPTTGPRPPPGSNFTFTAINEKNAVYFGGLEPGRGRMNDVFIMNFTSMVWTRMEKPEGAPWPVGRSSHAACCLNYGDDHPVLLMTGGIDQNRNTLNDAWLLDVHSGRWKELTLPEGTQPRLRHTLTACNMEESRVHATTFGGSPHFVPNTSDDAQPKLANTTVLEFESVQSGDDPSSRQWVLVGVADSSQLGSPERIRELEKLKQRKTEHAGSVKVAVKNQIETEDQHLQAGSTTKQSEEIKLVDLDHELSETSSWVRLGLYLGLPKHKLNEIHADYGTQGLGRCKLEMLSSVLDRGTLSWATVVEAASKTGNNRIAKKIADKHGVQFTATVDAVPPISEEDTELHLLKEKVRETSQKLETGETLFQACSEKKLQLEGNFTEAQRNHEFAQKYTNMLVEDKRMFQQKLEQREKQIEHLQSKQLEYEGTIRGLEVKLAGASANLEAQQKLKGKLKRLKEQKQNLVDEVESNKREIDRLCEKKDELKQKLDKSEKEASAAESQLKVKSNELFEAEKQLELVKVENDKLLEQLKKQERATDVAIVSYGMSQPDVEEQSQYENLKLSRWVEEMEGMEKALLAKDAHIQELEGEDKYMNTSKVGLRAEMKGMEEEIRKLKMVRGQHKYHLPKDISPHVVGTIGLPTTAAGSGMMHRHPEDKVAPDGSTLKEIQQQLPQTNLSTGPSQQIGLPTD